MCEIDQGPDDFNEQTNLTSDSTKVHVGEGHQLHTRHDAQTGGETSTETYYAFA